MVSDTLPKAVDAIDADDRSRVDPSSEADLIDPISGLLCARTYLFGIVGSVGTINTLLGGPYRSADPGIGYNRRLLLYHALQSGLLSLVFLAVSLALFKASHATLVEMSYANSYYWLLVGVVVTKVAILNPWIARYFFADEERESEFRIPLLGRIAAAARDVLLRHERYEPFNVYYFAGKRPFVGYGTEINSWAVVIDTSVPSQGAENLAGAVREPESLCDYELYQAVREGLEDLEEQDMAIDSQVFVDGRYADKELSPHRSRLHRPQQRLSEARIAELDCDATRGRQYMVVRSKNQRQDLVVTQFLRFQDHGRLIFCEFASYVLAPGRRWLYVLRRLFGINSILYTLVWPIAFLILSSLFLFIYPYLIPLVFFDFDPIFFRDIMGSYDRYVEYVFEFWFQAHAIVALSALYLVVILGWRLLWFLVATADVMLCITNQFGLNFSYRERFASRGELGYYELQETIRFLKTQEKVLINSIYTKLSECGIDASDFKENVVAYINQGVINSGDIRGNVISSISSFVFRRPNKSAVKRYKGRASK